MGYKTKSGEWDNAEIGVDIAVVAFISIVIITLCKTM